jgi:hypothetical protein
MKLAVTARGKDLDSPVASGRHNGTQKGEWTMPFGDRTGPMGLGPMMGRGAGYCAGFYTPGNMNPALAALVLRHRPSRLPAVRMGGPRVESSARALRGSPLAGERRGGGDGGPEGPGWLPGADPSVPQASHPEARE